MLIAARVHDLFCGKGAHKGADVLEADPAPGKGYRTRPRSDENAQGFRMTVEN
jgi:hypothetical protein